MRINPFPGLRAFAAEEHHLFFGREKHISDLLHKLRTHHFVAVVGSSGSGKSSLIRAGLLPAIEEGKLGHKGDQWVVTSMKPGNAPLSNLMECINVAGLPGTHGDADLLALMQEDSLGLVQGIRPDLLDGKKLVILVDQFEELFRFRDEGGQHYLQEADRFAQVLISTISQKDVPIYIILTLRSDFIGDCVTFEGLPEAINDGHYLVPRLNKDERRAVILQPVEHAEGKISPRLIQRLLNDLNDDQDQLPILQHALHRTWEHWAKSAEEGEPMDIKHYEAIGGMEHALSLHADEAFNDLISEEDKELIRRVFQTLTIKTNEGRGLRRPTALSKIGEITARNREDVLRVLRPFRVEGRSFVVPGVEVDSEDMIMDISHESLMRGWERLREWVEEERESTEIYERLTDRALLHEKGQSGYYQDPELRIAVDWKLRKDPSLIWSEQYNEHFEEAMAFLDESVAQDKLAQMGRRRRRRMVRVAVIAFLLVVSGLSIWALFQTDRATRNSRLAEQRAKDAKEQQHRAERASEEATASRLIAEQQRILADSNEHIAVLNSRLAEAQALLAIERGDEANQQRLLAESQRSEAILQRERAEAASIEARRRQLLSVGQKLSYRATQVKDPQLAALLANEAYHLIQENAGDLFDAQLSDALIHSLQLNEQGYGGPVMTSKETILDMVPYSNGIRAINSNEFMEWSNNSKRSKPLSSTENVNSAYLSHEGERAFLGLGNFDGLVLNLQDGSRQTYSGGHTQLIRAAGLPDIGGLVATGARDSSVCFWEQGKRIMQIRLNARVRDLVFRSDGQSVVAGTEDGSVYLLKATGEQTLLVHREAERVECLAVNDGKNLFAIGFSKGTVLLLDSYGRKVGELREGTRVDEIGFSKERNLLFTVLALRQIKVYSIKDLSREPLVIQPSVSILRACMGVGGQLYTVHRDGSIRLMHVHPQDLQPLLLNMIKRDWEIDEWKELVGEDIPYQERHSLINS